MNSILSKEKKVTSLANIFKVTIIGALLGVWITFAVDLLFVCILITIISLLILKYFQLEERKFLIKIFFFALFIRFSLASLYYFLSMSYGSGGDFFGDARIYSYNGLYIARTILNTDPKGVIGSYQYAEIYKYIDYYFSEFKGALPSICWYSLRTTSVYSYFIGFLYMLFGYVPLMIKLLNSVFCVLAAIFIYAIVRDIFDINTARLSLLLVIFYPSLVFWSITGLKEAFILFFISLFLWSTLKLQKVFKWLYLWLMVLSFLLLGLTRTAFFLPPALTGCFAVLL